MKTTKMKLKIAGLERELEYQKKEAEFSRLQAISNIELQQSRSTKDLEIQLAKAKTEAEQSEARLKDAPYSQLTELLKAIVVKLPTLNINELSVKTKKED